MATVITGRTTGGHMTLSTVSGSGVVREHHPACECRRGERRPLRVVRRRKSTFH